MICVFLDDLVSVSRIFVFGFFFPSSFFTPSVSFYPSADLMSFS